jgi:hypothetical protein
MLPQIPRPHPFLCTPDSPPLTYLRKLRSHVSQPLASTHHHSIAPTYRSITTTDLSNCGTDSTSALAPSNVLVMSTTKHFRLAWKQGPSSAQRAPGVVPGLAHLCEIRSTNHCKVVWMPHLYFESYVVRHQPLFSHLRRNLYRALEDIAAPLGAAMFHVAQWQL